MDKRRKFFWHGKPVKAEFGLATVHENTEKPFMWYNYECMTSSIVCSAMIDAVRITTEHGSTFILANHYGIGRYKLMKGGWPNCTHLSLPDDCSFMVDSRSSVKWDEEGFARHEYERKKWFEETRSEQYPDLWRKLEAAKSIAIRKCQP